MAEYIEKEAIRKVIQDYGKGAINDGMKTLDPVDDIIALAGLVDFIPAADVRENVRGVWNWTGHPELCQCSICREWIRKDSSRSMNFCPNCGARMEAAAIKETTTNADRIRALSDEELAEFLTELTDPEWHKNDDFPDYKPTSVGWLNWLRSPAAGGK